MQNRLPFYLRFLNYYQAYKDLIDLKYRINNLINYCVGFYFYQVDSKTEYPFLFFCSKQWDADQLFYFLHMVDIIWYVSCKKI